MDLDRIDETAYGLILNSYLENLLPTSEQKLSAAKSLGDWFSIRPTSPPANSPLKLLRPEVVASSFASEFTCSPTFRNFYPKLYQFINHLIKYLTSFNKWPTITTISTLRHVLEHYYRFLLTESSDREFMSFKMKMKLKPPFLKFLYEFLRRVLEDWPIDGTYPIVLGSYE